MKTYITVCINYLEDVAVAFHEPEVADSPPEKESSLDLLDGRTEDVCT